MSFLQQNASSEVSFAERQMPPTLNATGVCLDSVTVEMHKLAFRRKMRVVTKRDERGYCPSILSAPPAGSPQSSPRHQPESKLYREQRTTRAQLTAGEILRRSAPPVGKRSFPGNDIH